MTKIGSTGVKARRRAMVEEYREIIDGLSRTAARLQDEYSNFNNITEPELVEASVYEIKALKSRYAYYLRRAKEREG